MAGLACERFEKSETIAKHFRYPSSKSCTRHGLGEVTMTERNSIETVRHFRTVSFLFIFITFLLTGCNSYSKEEKKSEPVVRERNCQREYDQLSSKKFCDINDAIRAANDFLSYFENKGECSDCCSNVRRIKDDFSSMENLFSNIDERDEL